MLTVVEKVIFLQNVDVFAEIPTEQLSYLAAIAEEAKVNPKRTKKVMALLHDNEEAAFFWNKVKTAKFFCNAVLSEAPGKAEAIKAGDKSPMEVLL